MEYDIRELGKADCYDYMYVNTYAWNETYRGIINDDFLDKIINELEKNVENQKNKIDKDKLSKPNKKRFILYDNNEAVGVFSVDKSKEEKYPNSGELTSIYLLNKAKKQGYGKLMFNRAIEELKNIGFNNMVVSCIKENPSNEFYKHMGGKYAYSKEKEIGGQLVTENVYYFEKI